MKTFLLLTGPTAVGKTELSVALATRIGAEIISADSRQIYVGMDIGTAKPSAQERAQIRHHFIDELSIGQPFSAGRFLNEATARIKAIVGTGRVPLVVGGSTLYIHALKHGLADVPEIPDEVRRSVEADVEARGVDALYRELVQVDPRSARRMDPTKTQRLIRALEVHRATGRTLSAYQDDQSPPSHTFRTIVVDRPRAALYRRIDARVDEMLSRGLLGEVRGLLDLGYSSDLNPLRTIGYQEAIRHLRGEISYDEMVRLIKRNTRRYAKRQLTWFRRDPKNVWVDAARPLEQVIEDVLVCQG